MILERGAQHWEVFTWDRATEELQLVAAILRFCYETNRQDGWIIREDRTSYGTLIVDLEVVRTDIGINHMFLEADPHCYGYGRIRTNEHSRRGVLGASLLVWN